MNRDAQEARNLIAAARADGRAALDEAAGKRLLSLFGVLTPRSAVARDAGEAEHAAAGMSAPYVAKVVSTEILHKSDAGGVALNLADPASVRGGAVGVHPPVAGRA